MDAKTAKALEASILHWQENAAAETPTQAEISSDGCALCKIFYERTNEADPDGPCFGCPVRARSRRSECASTPWRKAASAWFVWEDDPMSPGARNNFRVAAQAEIDFLISLREPIVDKDA